MNHKCEKCGYPDAACPEQTTGNCGRMVSDLQISPALLKRFEHIEVKKITAKDMLRVLLMMDQEFDSAQNMLCDAKRERGGWNVNPLKNDHPAVVRKRKAVEARQSAIAAAQDFLNGEPT